MFLVVQKALIISFSSQCRVWDENLSLSYAFVLLALSKPGTRSLCINIFVSRLGDELFYTR